MQSTTTAIADSVVTPAVLGTPLIRPAGIYDRDQFADLVRAFLVSMYDQGSEVLPTDRTLSFYMTLFDQYLDGDQEGAALVADSAGTLCGVSMAGHVLPFDTVYGKTATGWLTYVTRAARGHGTGTHLRAALRSALCVLGYRAIAAGYHTWNAQSQRFIEQRQFKSLQVYGIETLDTDYDSDLPAPEAV